MGDTNLIAKLPEADMISRDACYHHKCTTGLQIYTEVLWMIATKMEKINIKDARK